MSRFLKEPTAQNKTTKQVLCSLLSEISMLLHTFIQTTFQSSLKRADKKKGILKRNASQGCETKQTV